MMLYNTLKAFYITYSLATRYDLQHRFFLQVNLYLPNIFTPRIKVDVRKSSVSIHPSLN